MMKLEADPSKSELISVCNSLQNLMISLRFKKVELAETEEKMLR